MATPANRVPVRIARGSKASLDASLADLKEGEIVFAKDENTLYVVENGALTASSALGEAPIDATDYVRNSGSWVQLDAVPEAPEDGSSYVRNNAAWVTIPDPAVALDDLNDVSITAPSEGNSLVYGATGWVNQTLSTSSLSDVSASAPSDGEVLTYNNSTSSYEPQSIPQAPVSSVNGETGAVSLNAGDLLDVSVVSPESNQYLTYDSGTGQFQNQVWKAIPGAPTSETSAGITGQIRFDPNFLYLCVSPNFWKKISLLSFGEGVATGVTADAGNFTAGISFGEDAIYDGGNFTTGATQDDQSVELDGGDFTGVLVDAGDFTAGTSSSEDVTYDGGNFTTGDSGSEDITLDGGSFTN